MKSKLKAVKAWAVCFTRGSKTNIYGYRYNFDIYVTKRLADSNARYYNQRHSKGTAFVLPVTVILLALLLLDVMVIILLPCVIFLDLSSSESSSSKEIAVGIKLCRALIAPLRQTRNPGCM